MKVQSEAYVMDDGRDNAVRPIRSSFQRGSMTLFSHDDYAEGPTYTTIMELGPPNQNMDGFLGPNSIGSVYGPSGLINCDLNSDAAIVRKQKQ